MLRPLVTLIVASISLSSMATCEDGLEAFKKTLHPKLVESCSKCHGDNGYVVKHSASDPRVAYPIARGLADFFQIQKSKFYKKVQAAHWLDYDDTVKGMTVTEMDEALNAWWNAGESSCPSPFGFETSKIEIPSNLPLRATNKFKKLTWNLEKDSATFKGCVFTVEAQVFGVGSGTVPKSYRLKNPSINCPTGTMKISNVRFLIDGSTQSFENIFDSVDAEITFSGKSVLLSEELLIIISRLDAKPLLSIGFGTLKITK